MLNRSRVLAEKDGGYTLSELLVALALMSIVATIAMTFFTLNSAANSTTYEKLYNTAQARLSLDAWTALLRVADSPNAGSDAGRLVEITPDAIVFHANLENRNASGAPTAPTKIRLALDSGTLTETRYDASGSVTARRVLARGVSASDPTGWVFVPWSAGNQVPTALLCASGASQVVGYCDTGATDYAPTAGGSAMLPTVDRIVIGIKVTDTANRAPVTFTSGVAFTG